MRILIVSPRWPSPALPMRGMRSNEQFRLFRAAGCDLSAVVPVPWAPAGCWGAWAHRRRVPPSESDHGVTITHPRYLSLGRLANLPAGPALQRALYGQALEQEVASFRRGGPGIVHIHSCALPGVLLGRVRPAKLVVTMHDHELATTVPGHRAWGALIAATLRGADHVVYVSPKLQRAGEALIGPHPSSVIPLAVDDPPERLPAQSEAFTVVTVARLVPGKNIEHVIEAFARAFPPGREPRPQEGLPPGRQPCLRVVGDGPTRRGLEALARHLGLGGMVQFLGHLPNASVREVMAEGHLFVLPSAPESLGTVYFEAMSVGMPVVGTRGEGISDFITEGVDGFLVRAGDLDALARIMRQMHDDPERRRSVGAHGHTLFQRTGVLWRDSVAAHLRIYEELLRTDE